MLCLDIEVSDTDEDGTNNIKGKGITDNGESWTLAGTVTPEGPIPGRLQVQFDRTLPDEQVIYEGAFIVEQKMLSGVFKADVDGPVEGSFLFKRTFTPYIMCHRPLVEKPDAKALLSFACRAVLDNIRRRSFSKNFLFERVMMVKTWVKLTHKKIIQRLDPAEIMELSCLCKSFTPAEYRAVNSLSRWFSRVGDLQR